MWRIQRTSIARRPGTVLISHPCANLWECADGQFWYELESSLCNAWKVWWEPRVLRLEGRLTRPVAGIQPVVCHSLLHLPVWHHSNLSICPSYSVWGKQSFQSDHPFIDPLRPLASAAWFFPSMWISVTFGHKQKAIPLLMGTVHILLAVGISQRPPLQMVEHPFCSSVCMPS